MFSKSFLKLILKLSKKNIIDFYQKTFSENIFFNFYKHISILTKIFKKF